jgi:UDP-N-acetylmuramate dehydrogenase
MSERTWYHIGGFADFLAFPSSVPELQELLAACLSLAVPVYVLGEGANVLISDRGFRGVIVNLRGGFEGIRFHGRRVEAQAGVTLRKLVYECERRNLAGCEGLSGIPGTVGGALIMNAGTDMVEIGNLVTEVNVLESNGETRRIVRDHIGFSYRHAPALEDTVVLGGTLELVDGDEGELREKRLDLLARRASKQPLEFPSCGSVFKRPDGHFVGKLVEEAGLKGLRHGDAVIAEKHGGFIVNLGNASADDVLYLVDTVREEVNRRYNVILDLEVRLVGFD